MKYSIHINQSGISDAGLADGRTDLVDWAIVDYIGAFIRHSTATLRNGRVWINYGHLIKEMPLLGLNSKQAVSKRIHRLSGLGLISIEQDEDKRIYASLTPACECAIDFRQDRQPNGTCVNHGLQGVNHGLQGVNHGGHSAVNHLTDNKNREIEIASPTAPPNECGASTGQPIPVKPKPRPREASQGTRLPTDWALTQELGESALSEGLTRDRIRQEADRFRDYWIAKPGAAGRKTDWPATWRNWVRRASETKTGGTNGQSGRPDRESVSARAVREAAEFIADLDAADRAERCQADGGGGIHENELALPWEGVGRL
jgi:hypothetical protein